MQAKVLGPPKNASTAVKSKYKKGDLKAKKILIDGFQDHLHVYVGSLKKSKDIYGNLVGMYEVNNLNYIISLKNNLKELKMNKGEFLQSYIMKVSQLRDQLQIFGVTISVRELVMITLKGLPHTWETFITTIRNKNILLTFDELIGQCTQEETMMIARGKIQKHEEREPSTFLHKIRRRKVKGNHIIQ